jgi:hypothetical protein
MALGGPLDSQAVAFGDLDGLSRVRRAALRTAGGPIGHCPGPAAVPARPPAGSAAASDPGGWCGVPILGRTCDLALHIPFDRPASTTRTRSGGVLLHLSVHLHDAIVGQASDNAQVAALAEYWHPHASARREYLVSYSNHVRQPTHPDKESRETRTPLVPSANPPR